MGNLLENSSGDPVEKTYVYTNLISQSLKLKNHRIPEHFFNRPSWPIEWPFGRLLADSIGQLADSETERPGASASSPKRPRWYQTKYMGWGYRSLLDFIVNLFLHGFWSAYLSSWYFGKRSEILIFDSWNTHPNLYFYDGFCKSGRILDIRHWSIRFGGAMQSQDFSKVQFWWPKRKFLNRPWNGQLAFARSTESSLWIRKIMFVMSQDRIKDHGGVQ